MPGPRAYLEVMTRRGRGQSTVELALTLPVLLLLVLGIVDFGRVFVSANVLSHATTDAARYGALNPTQVGPGAGTIRGRVIDEAARSSVTLTDQQVDIYYLDAGGQVTSCFINGSATASAPGSDATTCPGGCPVGDTCPSPPLPGDYIQVKTHLPWNAATVLIQNVLPNGFTIDSSAAGVIQQ
jgi:Flp pilus assembly protein TadG